jgi:hypothetical protein
MSLKTFLGKSLPKKECDINGVKIPVLNKERPYKKPNNFYIKLK